MLKALFASVGVLSIAIASPASAHQARHVYVTQNDTYQVEFRDLDLSDRDSRSELMSRIIYASQLTCSQNQDLTRGEIKRCIRASVTAAVAAAPAPVQMALQDQPMMELAQR